MDNQTPTAFHCPSCGALSQAGSGDGGEIVCAECGYEFRKPIRVAPRGAAARLDPRGQFVQRDVVSRRRQHERGQVVPPVELPALKEATSEPGATSEAPAHREEVVLEDGTRKVTKRRKRKRPDHKRRLVFMLFWVLLVALMVIGVKEFIKRDHQPVEETESDKEKRVAKARTAQVQTYLNKHLQECREVLGEFFAASDTSIRAQFVSNGPGLTPRMATYYQTNLAVRPEKEFFLHSSGLRIMGEEPGIETVWELDDGSFVEASFVREKGNWRIDWEEFVRFGTVPWHQFLDRVDRQGEFRLYMRQRQVLVDPENNLGLQFYPPLDDSGLRQRGESPRVLVRKDSEMGRRLLAHWDNPPGNPGEGDTMFGERDPEGLSRVRVVLAWEAGESGEEQLMLREFISGAWWGDQFPSTLEDLFSDGEEPEVVGPGG